VAKKDTFKMNILEKKVRELLGYFSIDEYTEKEVAPHIAKISLKMNHLYFDLGMKNRIEMGKYMKTHFPKLADKKPSNKFWKKFIYDTIGEVAPSCSTCKDKINCFSCES